MPTTTLPKGRRYLEALPWALPSSLTQGPWWCLDVGTLPKLLQTLLSVLSQQ